MPEKFKFSAALLFLFSLPSFPSHAAKFDVVSYEGHMILDPGAQQIEANIKVNVQALEDGVSELFFFFQRQTKVLGLKGFPFKQNEGSTDLVVSLPKPLKTGETLAFSAAYQVGIKPMGREGGFNILNPIPLNASLQGANDPFLFDLQVEAPSSLTVILTGARRGITRKKNTTVWSWKAEVPYDLLILNTGVYREQVKSIKIQNKEFPLYGYFFKEHENKADVVFSDIQKALEFFSEKFMLYPYEKLAIIEVEEGDLPRRAMALPSFIALTRKAVEQYDRDPSLIPHEISHEWWGSWIPLGMLQATWLWEGLATYSESIFMEEALGQNFFPLIERGYFRLVEQKKDAPVSYGYIAEGGASSYDKGALVFRMLQFLMGDEKFFEALHAYLKESHGKTPTTRIFQKICERVYGKELKWFFKQWVDGTGGMDVFVKETTATVTEGSEDYEFRIVLSQKPPLYKMPVELLIKTGKGEVREKVWIESETASHVFILKGKPYSVEIDPDRFLILLNRPPLKTLVYEIK